MTTLSESIAQMLLDVEAVCLSPNEPFTWASGLKSPIYCDNRLIMSDPEARRVVVNGLVETIKAHYPDVELVAGTATAGIPHAAFVAQRLNLPMIYVRSSAKDHGKGNQIEGKLCPGQKVVMIEDLISTGGSVIQAADAVAAAGGEVLGCVAIFNYSLPKGRAAFTQSGYPLVTLTDYVTLVKLAAQTPEMKQYEDTLTEWYHNPVVWSKKYEETHQKN